MGKIRGIFASRKKTIVFVDYEYWFYSYKTKYGTKPDIEEWRDKLNEDYNIDEIMVFGDFTSSEIRPELLRLREITSTIIETGNTFQHHKKDLTDFVMLDYIYQCAETRRDIGRYILFTGDGHFQSVVRYLKQKKKREVIVYGIRETFSRQLRDAATYAVEVPDSDMFSPYYRMIIRNFAYVSGKNDIIPTFNGTVDTVTGQNGVPRERVRAALISMMNEGYIYHREFEVEKGKTIKVLSADWEKLAACGMIHETIV